MNKYLVAGGCSYTGGGGFNNPQIFNLEFPNIDVTQFEKYHTEIDWLCPKFREFIKPYLWPSILSDMLNYKESYNLAGGGKGIYTSINSIYHFIYKWQSDSKDVTELEIWFQIPNHNRVETYINNIDKHRCILTEFDDSSDIKKTFINNFFDEDFNLLISLHEVYKLKKYCDSLGIVLYIIPWSNDSMFKNGLDYIKLRQRIDKYSNDTNKQHFYKLHTNIYDVTYYDIDLILDELNIISVENNDALSNYLERNFDSYYFESKYPNISSDRHMTSEGHIEYAKLLKKIVKINLEN
jgi:hypothetical protein